MRSSRNKNFDVFDFKADDEIVESVSGRFAGKFRNPKSESPPPPPITKYEFLECVSKEADIQQMQISNIDEPANVISDEDGSMKTSCHTSSDLGENEVSGSSEEPTSNSCSVGWEMDAINLAVVVSPDYLIYGERYCTESLLTFSCSCIMLEGSNACGNKDSFSSEWAIFDVTHIESQWCGMVETALVKLCVRASAAMGAETSYKAPDILELKFAVYDRHWPQKQEKIMSLNARYKAVWEVTIDNGMAREEVDYVGQNGLLSSNRYFSNDKNFEDVVYPKGDPDAVSISKRDVELLRPETFINDTLIDFYIKYLKNKIEPEDQHRFHFFNSFFFRKLADLDKDPSSAFEGRAAFQRVRKWTRKVNLFEKDYIFIPVNFNLHWSLIVICHLGEVANFEGKETDDFHKVPCILHMDSIKGSHKGLKNLVQSYLCEEWKERQAESSEDLSSKFLNLRFIPLELPQQENSFDCGLFLLHYVECFLEKAPVNFSPFRITKLENFLSFDWFPPSEASLKRGRIQKLIQELLEDHSHEIPQAACNDVLHCGSPKKNNEKENGLVFLSESCSLAEIGDSNSSFPTVDQGIEITLLEKSPLGGSQFVRDQGLVFRELFEPETTAETFSGGQYRSIDQHAPHTLKGAMSPIEEEEEEEEKEIQDQMAYSPSSTAGCWPPAGLTFEACPTYGMLEPLCNPDFSMRLEEHNDADSSPRTSSFESQNAFELGSDDLPPIRDFASQNQQGTEKAKFALAENICSVREGPASSPSGRLETCIVVDSQEMERTTTVKENEESLSCKENSPAWSHEETYSTEVRNPEGDNNVRLSGDESNDAKSESDEHHHIAKRPRLMLSAEG